MYQDIIKEEGKEDKKSNAVYDLVDHAQSFWQNTDVPLEHMLNT